MFSQVVAVVAVALATQVHMVSWTFFLSCPLAAFLLACPTFHETRAFHLPCISRTLDAGSF
jgi:hypothetical protein